MKKLNVVLLNLALLMPLILCIFHELGNGILFFIALFLCVMAASLLADDPSDQMSHQYIILGNAALGICIAGYHVKTDAGINFVNLTLCAMFLQIIIVFIKRYTTFGK